MQRKLDVEKGITREKCNDQDSEKENVLKQEVSYIEGVKSHGRFIPEIRHPCEVKRRWETNQNS